MEVCTASQGAFLSDLTLSGRAGVPYMCHSISNPIFGASRVIKLFYEWQEKWRKENKYYIGGAPFSCDLALYGENGGMPAVILGTRGDNLHAPDEWVLIEDIFSLIGNQFHIQHQEPVILYL